MKESETCYSQPEVRTVNHMLRFNKSQLSLNEETLKVDQSTNTEQKPSSKVKMLK